MRHRHQRFPNSAVKHSQHNSIAIQLEEDELPTLPNPESSSPSGSPFQKQPRDQKMRHLLGNLDSSRREGESRELERRSRERVEERRVKVDVMSLQEKVFNYDKNIYNIALGDLVNKDSKMELLKEEINALKDRIQQL